MKPAAWRAQCSRIGHSPRYLGGYVGRGAWWRACFYRRLGLAGLALVVLFSSGSAQAGVALLNVSYDATREYYKEIDSHFVAEWKAKTGEDITIRQSHSGSGKQARAVIDGLEADVVTLAAAPDIDVLHEKANLLPANWQERLPDNSCPYYSTVIFLERRNGRVRVKDWDDLTRPGVSVVAPNPKTSGGARWIYLAAYGYAWRKHHGDAAAARRFVEQLYRHVPVMDEGARGATTTFAQHGMGDVLILWENEAMLVVNGFGRGRFEVVYPSMSIRAEPPVAVVEKYAVAHGTRAAAEAYLRYLYSPEAQEIAARHYLRPTLEEVVRRHEGEFPQIQLFTVSDLFGSWKEAQRNQFDEGGVFDQIEFNRR